MALTVLLFILTIFLWILPMMQERLLDAKREVIRELVASAWIRSTLIFSSSA